MKENLCVYNFQDNLSEQTMVHNHECMLSFTLNTNKQIRIYQNAWITLGCIRKSNYTQGSGCVIESQRRLLNLILYI